MTTSAATPVTSGETGRSPLSSGRRRAALVTVLAVALVLAAGGWWWWSSSGDPRTRATDRAFHALAARGGPPGWMSILGQADLLARNSGHQEARDGLFVFVGTEGKAETGFLMTWALEVPTKPSQPACRDLARWLRGVAPGIRERDAVNGCESVLRVPPSNGPSTFTGYGPETTPQGRQLVSAYAQSLGPGRVQLLVTVNYQAPASLA